MSKQLELDVEERTVSAKEVRRLRHQGIVPANMYGHGQPSVALQVSGMVLQKLLARGGSSVISLKVGNQPPVQALIKRVERDPLSRKPIHVEFYRVAATEKLKTRVPLHFVNEPTAAALDGGNVSRLMNDVLVECLPADLPTNIQVDLSSLKGEGDVIRVGDLALGQAVTILNDPNEMVAGVHLRAHAEKVEEAEAKPEPAATPETPA